MLLPTSTIRNRTRRTVTWCWWRQEIEILLKKKKKKGQKYAEQKTNSLHNVSTLIQGHVNNPRFLFFYACKPLIAFCKMNEKEAIYFRMGHVRASYVKGSLIFGYTHSSRIPWRFLDPGGIQFQKKKVSIQWHRNVHVFSPMCYLRILPEESYGIEGEVG